MLSDYTDRINKYQNQEYEAFLKQKKVLDAWQFLHSSLLYFNYALITQRLFEDASAKCTEESRNPLYNNIQVLGWNYPANVLLNKFALEWITHISNSIDCILQYTNAALNMGISHGKVSKNSVLGMLGNDHPIKNAIKSLYDDEAVKYIKSLNNYSKHTEDLFGGFFFPDLMQSKRNIHFPSFRFNGDLFESRTIVGLFDHYEEVIKKYLSLLDSIDAALKESLPIPNRFYIGGYIIDGQVTAEAQATSDLVVNVQLGNGQNKAIRYWIENCTFSSDSPVEIMPYHTKNTGTHFEHIDEIEVFNHGAFSGKLVIIQTSDRSVLAFHKYNYEAE